MTTSSASAPTATQLHNSSSGWDGMFDPTHVVRGTRRKPANVFYTSSLEGDTSEWIRWASVEMPRLVRPTDFLFGIVGNPKLMVLGDDEDFRREARTLTPYAEELDPEVALGDIDFSARFWNHARSRYDGIHIPKVRDHLSYAGMYYNCECTAWFKPWRHLQHLQTNPRAVI